MCPYICPYGRKAGGRGQSGEPVLKLPVLTKQAPPVQLSSGKTGNERIFHALGERTEMGIFFRIHASSIQPEYLTAVKNTGGSVRQIAWQGEPNGFWQDN
jgi:hypothetical protein